LSIYAVFCRVACNMYLRKIDKSCFLNHILVFLHNLGMGKH